MLNIRLLLVNGCARFLSDCELWISGIVTILGPKRVTPAPLLGDDAMSIILCPEVVLLVAEGNQQLPSYVSNLELFGVA